MRVGGQILGEAWQDARTRFDQHDARLARVDAAKIVGQRFTREFGDRAGELDPGRAAADDDEGQLRRAQRSVALAFGALEGHQNSPAHRGRVLERLEAGREALPFVMAEIGVPGAGRQHQRIEFDRVAAFQQRLALARHRRP